MTDEAEALRRRSLPERLRYLAYKCEQEPGTVTAIAAASGLRDAADHIDAPPAPVPAGAGALTALTPTQTRNLLRNLGFDRVKPPPFHDVPHDRYLECRVCQGTDEHRAAGAASHPDHVQHQPDCPLGVALAPPSGGMTEGTLTKLCADLHIWADAADEGDRIAYAYANGAPCPDVISQMGADIRKAIGVIEALSGKADALSASPAPASGTDEVERVVAIMQRNRYARLKAMVGKGPPKQFDDEDHGGPTREHEAREILAALREDGWRTIASRPLDGTLKLFWCPAGEMFIAPDVPFEEPEREARLAMYQASGEFPNAKWTPTHWRPLPAPPSLKKAREDGDG